MPGGAGVIDRDGDGRDEVASAYRARIGEGHLGRRHDEPEVRPDQNGEPGGHRRIDAAGHTHHKTLQLGLFTVAVQPFHDMVDYFFRVHYGFP